MKKVNFYIASTLGLILSVTIFLHDMDYLVEEFLFYFVFLPQIAHSATLIIIRRKNFDICLNLCAYFGICFFLLPLVAFVPKDFSHWYVSIMIVLLSAWLIYVTYMFSFKNKSPQFLLRFIQLAENNNRKNNNPEY
jgi:hypothetical protein